MGLREDYYKFTHVFFPHAVFTQGKLLVERVLKKEDFFVFSLRNAWKSIQLEKTRNRSAVPNFSIEIRKLNEEHKVIILSIPEASNPLEAPFIGVVFDTEYNIRYFTYEIAKGTSGEVIYFLCEWTSQEDHINYNLYKNLDIEGFVEGISDQIVYQML